MTNTPYTGGAVPPPPGPMPANRVSYWTGMSLPPRRTFQPAESLFGWLCWLFGYGFCRAFPLSSHPLGSFLLTLTLFAVTALFLYTRRLIKRGWMPWAVAGVALVASAGWLLSSSSFIHQWCGPTVIVAYAYFVYAAVGNRLRPGFSNAIAVDFVKALFVMPCVSMGEFFRGLFAGRAKKGGKTLLKLLAGMAIAFIPTVVVLFLLSYDSRFTDLLANLFSFRWGTLFSHLGSVIVGIPVGMALFSLYISSVDGKESQMLSPEKCRTAMQRMRVLPTVTLLSATLPLLGVYLLFFISQGPYYLSGFTGVLPPHFSYALYAREGFFQLCVVAVINLAVLVGISLFARRQRKKSALLRGLRLVFAVFTLVLIATALSKMGMYIDYYGLTPKRVYATWLMGVLAILFIFIGVAQFVRLKTVAISLAVVAVCFAGLAVANVDGMIAAYNADRYLDGTLEELDVTAMEELGDAAVPSLLRLAEELSPLDEAYEPVRECLMRRAEAAGKDSLFTLTLPALRARHALRQAGYME